MRVGGQWHDCDTGHRPGQGPPDRASLLPRTLEDVSLAQISAAGMLPQPLVGAIAVGIPLLIIALFFVYWDRPKKR